MFLAASISVPDLTIVLGIKFLLGIICVIAFVRECFTYFDERKRQDEVNAEFHRITSFVLLCATAWAIYELLKGIVIIEQDFINLHRF